MKEQEWYERDIHKGIDIESEGARARENVRPVPCRSVATIQ